MINITFSRYVKMNGRQWEVNFRKVPNSSSTYFADTPDLQGERFQFMLERKNESEWELKGTSVPQWLSDYLPQLVTAVQSGVEEYRSKYAVAVA